MLLFSFAVILFLHLFRLPLLSPVPFYSAFHLLSSCLFWVRFIRWQDANSRTLQKCCLKSPAKTTCGCWPLFLVIAAGVGNASEGVILKDWLLKSVRSSVKNTKKFIILLEKKELFLENSLLKNAIFGRQSNFLLKNSIFFSWWCSSYCLST